MSSGRTLVVMARWPAPGRCKSRLAAGIGRPRAAAVQGRLCRHTCAVARQARQRLAFELVLAGQGVGPRALRRWVAQLGCDRGVEQGPGSLGVRLQRQVLRARRGGAEQVVLVGSDLPELDASDLVQAFRTLETQPLVLGPAGDGGYWLIGLNGCWPALFCGIPWGSSLVLEHTTQAAGRLGLEPRWLSRRHDLDRPDDLAAWR
ncbi:TIGR04282 family arsenosugar biosynthesis glycosyltransferase [Cyanobium sp. CH-040]|uniref:TIGR04282 family arsenosugar biosynthesis glycosyltransferase n=1 Tax=Cyanobium sp. CH-040 TaxID=2823708 RepID=UPI0020CE2D08|nr:TIGR04282 family arsenosugar biosynthesis glycosyltransferase [Cyanobium sp. CH-040]